MPSSKWGGLIPSRKNRRKMERPMMIHGVHSLSTNAFFQVSNVGPRIGKSASAPPWALLALAVRILVTGGCGFIGSNFIRYILQHYKPASVTNVDALTYAGNLANLDGVVEEHGERYEFFKADIANTDAMDALMLDHQFFAVVNFAAESHVDRSINSPENFIHTNVIGTSVLLNSARKHGVQRFVQISTDEVYGSLGKTGKFTEQSPLDPSSPYSSSKAGADLLALAHHRTYGQEVIVTRCSNNYGPYQFPEKLIPLMIIKALRDEALPVYGDGMNVRDWIHVQDHCAAVVAALFEGKPGAVYNFGGGNEMPNLDLVKMILNKLGKPESLISFVKDRLGHDRRYAIDSSFAQKALKWKPRKHFKDSLEETTQWYIDNQPWWQPLLERAGRY
jgi:dTDP-glucose 4,6-dehydratase